MTVALHGLACGHCTQPAAGMVLIGEHLLVEHQDADGNRIKVCGAPCPDTQKSSPTRARPQRTHA